MQQLQGLQQLACPPVPGMAAQLVGLLQQLRSLELAVDKDKWVTEVAQAEAPQLAALTQLMQLVDGEHEKGRWWSQEWHEALVEQLSA
jgi:hypothetical protein